MKKQNSTVKLRGGMVSSKHSVDIAKERLEAGYDVIFVEKSEVE